MKDFNSKEKLILFFIAILICSTNYILGYYIGNQSKEKTIDNNKGVFVVDMLIDDSVKNILEFNMELYQNKIVMIHMIDDKNILNTNYDLLHKNSNMNIEQFNKSMKNLLLFGRDFLESGAIEYYNNKQYQANNNSKK